MKIFFWGVRGSIPTPSKDTVRYGGNTACIEVRNDNNEIIIIDAGTGIRSLGVKLINEFTKNKQSLQALILFSHTHWDHIQGIPFFSPLYIPNNVFEFVGPEGTKRNLEEIFELQMDHDFFPLNFSGLPSNITFKQVTETEFDYKNFHIQTKILNHGGLGCVIGYKITADNKSVVYCSDHEGYELFFKSNSEKTHKIIENMEMKYRNFIGNTDLLIHDSQYDNDDYKIKRGWGHSSYDYAINNSVISGVKALSFVHYDPDYSDDKIDKIVEEAKQKLKAENKSLKLIAGYEGLEINL